MRRAPVFINNYEECMSTYTGLPEKFVALCELRKKSKYAFYAVVKKGMQAHSIGPADCFHLANALQKHDAKYDENTHSAIQYVLLEWQSELFTMEYLFQWPLESADQNVLHLALIRAHDMEVTDEDIAALKHVRDTDTNAILVKYAEHLLEYHANMELQGEKECVVELLNVEG